MTKTIEEAAKRFADRECEIGQVDWDALYKGYYHGMKDLFAQSLTSRMTEEEKERVMKLHGASIVANQMYGKDDRAFDALERIFGKELFERKEE